jgi:hypothetical protein
VSSNWPFIAFQGIEYNEDKDDQDNYVWLLNLYHTSVINRIQMPKDLIQICFTYMCENYDLFVVGETEENYELYHIDLDSYTDMRVKGEANRLLFHQKIATLPKEHIFTDKKDVEHQLNSNIMTAFHVKS